MKFRFSPRARMDLIGIWEFIAIDSVEAAHKVIARIESEVELLKMFPGMGHPRIDSPVSSYRFWKVYSYLLVYRATRNTFVIVRIIDGRRDLKRALK